MSDFYKDKTAIVTGAAGGVGKVASRLYLEKGAKIFATDVNPAIEDEIAALQAEFGEDRVIGGVCDIRKGEDCKAIADAVVEKWGKIDFLASIAGMLQDACPVKDMDEEIWDKVYGVNVKGPMLLCRAVLPYMEEAKSGNIVTVSSWWGHRGYAYFSAYCSSKAALIKFTQALAEEMADFGGRANVLCPGNINTSMHIQALESEAAERGITFEEMRDECWNAIPLKKPADPEDIANGILFLNSPEAKYITGATLNINGGCDIR